MQTTRSRIFAEPVLFSTAKRRPLAMPRASTLASLVAASALTLGGGTSALAKKAATPKGKGAPSKSKAVAPSPAELSKLMGKYKWGMAPEDVVKIIADEANEKYTELVGKESDVYKQDQLRKQRDEEVEKFKASLVKFEGTKTGWDTSIIDKEFVHRNNESMLVRWEKDQRRFLFFWNGKLYKQYIAFNAEHPVFKGKTFDDFANILAAKYGQPETKFATLRTKDDVVVDHLEWPPAQDISLWAIDQSSFYGNFCLKLTQASVVASLESARKDKVQKVVKGNALIDAVTAPNENNKDPNDDIVDQIVGKKK
jgi:hypothetical protein